MALTPAAHNDVLTLSLYDATTRGSLIVRQIDAQGSVAVLAGKVRSGNTTMRHK